MARWLFGNPVSLTAIILASGSLVLLWYFLKQGKSQVLRVLAAFQVTMNLLAICYQNFPALLILKNGTRLSLLQDKAPQATITALAIALMIGSLFILPFLVYLFYYFQFRED